MKPMIAAGAVATALALCSPVHADEATGRWQVKLLGTAVLPDGEIDKVKYPSPALVGALPPDPQTRADDNYLPTVAVEYFLSPRISLEMICCVTQHDVEGKGTLAGAGLVSNAKRRSYLRRF